jgi:biotin carboxylase
MCIYIYVFNMYSTYLYIYIDKYINTKYHVCIAILLDQHGVSSVLIMHNRLPGRQHQQCTQSVNVTYYSYL